MEAWKHQRTTRPRHCAQRGWFVLLGAGGLLCACGDLASIWTPLPVDDTARLRDIQLPPLASAGADQVVLIATPVRLRGDGSYHPRGGELSFRWSQRFVADEPAISLSNPAEPNPGFIAPASPARLSFTLEVCDSRQCTSDEVAITVSGNAQLAAPVALAGPDRLAGESPAPAAADLLSLEPAEALASWEQVLPYPSGRALEAAPDLAGTLLYRLSASATYLASAPDYLVIYANPEQATLGDVPPQAGVLAPAAQAHVGEPVELDGSYSIEPNGQRLGYRWTQVAGDPVELLTGRDAPLLRFVAPLAPQELLFWLVVGDGAYESAPAVLRLPIGAGPGNLAPQITLGAAPFVRPGRTVWLSADGSSDPDGSSLVYSWSQTIGQAVALQEPNSAAPLFTAPEALGTLGFNLVISDQVAQSPPHPLLVHVVGEEVNSAPLLLLAPQLAEGPTQAVRLAVVDHEGDSLLTLACRLEQLDLELSPLPLDAASDAPAPLATPDLGHPAQQFLLVLPALAPDSQDTLRCEACDEFTACAQAEVCVAG